MATEKEGADAPLSLDAFVPQQTADFFPVIPGSDPPKKIGWRVTFCGPAHPKTVAAAKKAAQENAARAARITQAQINGKKWKEIERAPEETREEFIEGIVQRITDWSPVALQGTNYFPFDDTTAIKLLMLREMGLYVAQFVDYLLSEAAFMKASPDS